VCQSPSLQTQRNKFISAQVLYKQLYIYDPISKKEEKKYYHKQGHVTTTRGHI